MDNKIPRIVLNSLVICVSCILIMGVLFFVLIRIIKFNQQMQFEREYQHAQNTQKIEILEAKCTLIAAKFYAEAERERARGIVDANEILCNSWQKLNNLNQNLARYQ